MEVELSKFNHYRKKDDWLFMLIPSLSIGYCEKFFSITLYILNWELSLNFNFE